jgi:hypothetical protein
MVPGVGADDDAVLEDDAADGGTGFRRLGRRDTALVEQKCISEKRQEWHNLNTRVLGCLVYLPFRQSLKMTSFTDIITSPSFHFLKITHLARKPLPTKLVSSRQLAPYPFT